MKPPTAPAWIVGVDCAVSAKNVGMALAHWDGAQATLKHLCVGPSGALMAAWAPELIASWLSRPEPVLLALDAPLGWPQPLGRALKGHRPGSPLPRAGPGFDQLFSRFTDQFLHEKIGKRPLEIGADRIARTAAATLDLIDALRERGAPLPVAWTPGALSESSVIEVYPAATQKAYPALDVGPYKKEAKDVRRKMLTVLSEEIDLVETEGATKEHCTESDHALDALLCVLAGKDFLKGDVFLPPAEMEDVVAAEGWIWVKRPDS